MRIDIVTLFPEMFEGFLNYSIPRRAQAKGRAEVVLHNLRDYSLRKNRSVDDYPYGGGAGMVISVE
ncbi:MAG: tRNA (guanosine(37)-N1)-methyltransferase TrmD, partial [Bacteroidales bacterium]|nr:tRNA (guanosine(37)-N1)-methyltransferase TrmD [Bacteroidales bacterium]